MHAAQVDKLIEAAYELGASGHRLTAGFGGVDITNAVLTAAGSDESWMTLSTRDNTRIQQAFLAAHPTY